MKIGAVINPRAGGLSEQEGEERLKAVLQHLGPVLPAEWRRVVSASGVEPAARDLIDQGVQVVFAGGGDGTVSMVAGLAASAGIALGVLPLGTRNHFARDAGIALEMERWPEILRRLPRRRVDLGEVNGRTFINNVSVGMYPRMVEERDRKVKRGGWSKRPAQFLAGLRVLARFPVFRCVMDTPDGSIHRLTPILFAGNNEYDSGLFSQSRRATLAGGRLWICTAHAAGPISLLRLGWQACAGRLDGIEKMDSMLVEEIQIHFHRAYVSAAIDGETCRLETPLRLRSLKRVLEVVAP